MAKTPHLSRRALLGTSLAASTGLALSACQTAPPGGGDPTAPAATGSVTRPAHVPYDGPQPDMVGDGSTGVPNAFLSYPDPPPSTGRTPLGLSAPINFMVPGALPAIARGQNQIWQAMERDLGTELQFTAIPGGAEYNAKFQTSVASGDIPEIVLIPMVPQLPTLLDKMFTDLTPYLSGDKVKKYPNLANIPSPSWDSSVIAGKLWGFTNTRNSAGNVMMTRGDKLAAKGIPLMPDLANGEDFLDMCRELNDPAVGTFAMGQLAQTWTVPVIIEALGGPNAWEVTDGKWTSAYEHPAYERALEIVATMWAEKLFHPDSFSDVASSLPWFDEAATTSLLVQNIGGWQVRSGSSWKFDCGAVVMPKWEGGGKAVKHLGPFGVGLVGIRKTTDEKRIDELLRVADYIASPFGTSEYLTLWYGIRDRQYTLANKQVAAIPDAPKEAISAGYSYFGGMSLANIYANGNVDRTRRVFDYCSTMIPSGTKNPAQGRYSEADVTKGAAAFRQLDDAMSNIIQGRKPLAEWKVAVATWKSAAGDAIARDLEAQ